MTRPFIDLTGKKFDKLFVIGFSHKTKFVGGFKKYWLCRCDCGEEITKEGSKLTSKERKKSCGCDIDRKTNIVGQKYGFLTVLERFDNCTLVKCKCVCGDIKTYFTGNITTGKTKSCGCMTRKLMSESSPTKLVMDDIVEMAKKHDAICVSKEYINSNSKLSFTCNFNHTWDALVCEIRKYGCPYCSGARLTIETAQNIAKQKGGKCLSYEYECDKKIKWECKMGHIWDASLSKVKLETWCPYCPSSKNQEKIFKILSEIFPKYTIYNNFKGFKWLKTGGKGKQELDIYMPELKLAIEYDGKQHFEPVNFGGISNERAQENFKKTLALDIKKNSSIANHPDDIKSFIRFDYKEHITSDFVIFKLKLNGIEI